MEPVFLRVSMQYHPRLTSFLLFSLSSRTVWSPVKSRSSSYWPPAWKKVNNSIKSNRRAEPAQRNAISKPVLHPYRCPWCQLMMSVPVPTKDSVIIVTVFKFHFKATLDWSYRHNTSFMFIPERNSCCCRLISAGGGVLHTWIELASNHD